MSENILPNKVQPAYFAIIPARVRYSQDLPANAKLLYGEITALCNEKGYCWASNDYFACLYGVKKHTISDWVSLLVKHNFLAREIIRKEGSQEIDKRVLRLVEALPLCDKNHIPYAVNSDDPIRQKQQENNTDEYVLFTEVNNREKQKKKKFVIPSIKEIDAYCKERGNSVSAEAFHNFYSSKGWYVGKNKMKDWKAAVRTWEQNGGRKNSKIATLPTQKTSETTDFYRSISR